MKQGMELTYLVIQAIKKNPEWTNKQIAKACKCSEKMVEKIRSMFEI